MARTQRDQVEDQVRSRLQAILARAGVRQGDVAIEVLYWMPAEFVRAYQELYLRALHLGDGDDGEKAGQDEGRIVAKVKSASRGKKGSMAAQGGGKRYKVEWVIKDEAALAEKKRLDGKLVRLAQGIGRHGTGNGGGQGNAGENPRGQSQGSTPGVGDLMPMTSYVEGKLGKKQCRICGKIAASDWVRCPFPHS